MKFQTYSKVACVVTPTYSLPRAIVSSCPHVPNYFLPIILKSEPFGSKLEISCPVILKSLSEHFLRIRKESSSIIIVQLSNLRNIVVMQVSVYSQYLHFGYCPNNVLYIVTFPSGPRFSPGLHIVSNYNFPSVSFNQQ